MIGLLQDLFAGAQLGCLAIVTPWIIPIFQLLIFYDGWVDKKVHFRLEGSCLSFLTQLNNFKDSAKALSIFPLFPLFLGGALPSIYLEPLPFSFLALGFPFLYFRTELNKDHLLVLWEKQLFAAIIRPFRKKKKGFLPFVKKEILSSQEIYTSKASDYPLFRYTHGFKGKKTADIALRPKEKPHVMFLYIESFRAKDFGALGGKKGVTPHLDSLAKESHLFRHFYANSFPTFRSFYTSLFGLPYTLEMKSLLDKNIPIYGLPQLLKEHGYQTNFFTGGDWGVGGLGPLMKQVDADRIYDKKEVEASDSNSEGAAWGLHDEYLLEMTLDHFEKFQGSPQFYSILTTTSHHPWIVPTNHEPPPLEEVQNVQYRNYLQTLHYADQEVGKFIQKLKEKKLSKDLILFIMGDHGVSFEGEEPTQDYLGYGGDELFHVPLMIHADGRINKYQVIDERASQCDLLSTLMDLLNMKGHQHSIGRSLLREEKNPRLFFHNSFKVSGSLHCKEDRGNGEYNKLTREFSGTYPELFPLLETFEEMLSGLYDDHLIIPERYQKKGKQLSIEPQQFSPTLTRGELEEEIYQKSPMTSLTLYNNNHLNDDLLSKISTWNPDLDSFDINGSYSITDEALNNVLKGCKSLYDLNISNCLLLTEKCLEFLPNSLMKLNVFGLDFINDEHFIHTFKYLERLNIRETPLTEKGLFRLPKLFPTLVYLALSYKNATIESIEYIIDNLPLKYLLIGEGENLSEEEALRLFKKRPSLKSLHFGSCPNLTDKVFEQIGATNIIELYLQGVPRLTDRGLEAILKLPLEILHIDGAPNLSKEAFKLLDKHQEKFIDINVKVLNM